jgi:hypothetical protein
VPLDSTLSYKPNVRVAIMVEIKPPSIEELKIGRSEI